MRTPKRILGLALLTGLLLSGFTGCASGRIENGVKIEKSGSWDPLDYIPYL